MNKDNESLNPWLFVLTFYLFAISIILYLYIQIPQNEIQVFGNLTDKFNLLAISTFLLAIVLILPIGGEWRYKKAVKNGEEIIETGIMIRGGVARVKTLRKDYRTYISTITLIYGFFIFTLYTYIATTAIFHIDTSYWHEPGRPIQPDALGLIIPIIVLTIALIWVPYHFDKKAKQHLNTQSKT